MRINQQQFEALGGASFVQRVAQVLLDSQVVEHADLDPQVLHAQVARTLDEGATRGLKTERLLGMYVLLRLASKLDPFADPRMATVLRNPNLAEDDKAHLLQMIRLGEIGGPRSNG